MSTFILETIPFIVASGFICLNQM